MKVLELIILILLLGFLLSPVSLGHDIGVLAHAFREGFIEGH